MSWSVGPVIGKKQAVLAEIKRQFDSQTPCNEPEESVRQAAKAAMFASIEAQDDKIALRASASGSQGFRDWTNKAGVYNNVTVLVEPLHGFME